MKIERKRILETVVTINESVKVERKHILETVV